MTYENVILPFFSSAGAGAAAAAAAGALAAAAPPASINDNFSRPEIKDYF